MQRQSACKCGARRSVATQESDSNLWDVPDVFNHLYMQLVLGPRAERSAGARARACARVRRSPSKD